MAVPAWVGLAIRRGYRRPPPSGSPRCCRRAASFRRPSCRRSSRSSSSTSRPRTHAPSTRRCRSRRAAQPGGAAVPLRRRRRRPCARASIASPPACSTRPATTPSGQRAVAQVVLNRLRHPAFPKTVCGVVFEGSERTHRLPVHLHLRRRADPVEARPRPRGSARATSRSWRCRARSTRRSAMPRITTPTGSCPIGSRASTRSPRSTRICSSAGPAGGARRRRSIVRSSSGRARDRAAGRACPTAHGTARSAGAGGCRAVLDGGTADAGPVPRRRSPAIPTRFLRRRSTRRASADDFADARARGVRRQAALQAHGAGPTRR